MPAKAEVRIVSVLPVSHKGGCERRGRIADDVGCEIRLAKNAVRGCSVCGRNGVENQNPIVAAIRNIKAAFVVGERIARKA